MTPSDLERAEKAIDIAINSVTSEAAVEEIAKLITEVRNETLDLAASKARLTMVENQDVDELSCSIIAGEINQMKNTDKEGEK